MNSLLQLENEILSCSDVLEDILTVYHCEDLYSDQDRMMNSLLGIEALYRIKFERLYRSFELVKQEIVGKS